MASNYEFASGSLDTLYRFRSLGDEFGRTTAEDIILHSRMFWSSPAAFNDPMDCRPNLVFGRTEGNRTRWAQSAVDRHFPHETTEQRLRIAQTMLAGDPQIHRDRAMLGFTRWMQESAVCCFSTRPDNLLMWSHYGDQHRGVGFIFQEQLDPNPFVAFDVNYSDNRPEVDITRMSDTNGATMRDAVLTKAADWSYEAEKRMLDYRGGQGLRTFPANVFRGVIFGARIAEQDREFILGLIQQSGRDLQTFSANLSEVDFVLQIEED